MATFDKLIQEIGSRYCLGPMAYPLVQETLGVISGKPGGIGGFVNRIAFFGALLKAALFACTLFLSDRNLSSGPRQTMIAAR